ncbi:NUDIX hydrolase [Peterkaempfera griseoplana]|uniref:NUDIX hydrolase n=1 Tax=Peterkaempfera griseoplana TaxID=66896 RepID=UPI0006E27D27|nr:NUDIX hydrolase [Peterkaempfera griseoplana]
MTTHRPRVGAYGLCISDGQVLLTRFTPPDGTDGHWSLPGGGVEHGEDPLDAVVREVREETGYEVVVDRLLGVDSRTRRVTRDGAGSVELHGIGIFYRVRIAGGRLRHEVNGSSDLAAWFPVDEVPRLARATFVDVGLALERTEPLDGHVPPVPAGGLLRS